MSAARPTMVTDGFVLPSVKREVLGGTGVTFAGYI